MSEFDSTVKDSDFVSEIVTSLVEDVVDAGESKQMDSVDAAIVVIESSSSASSYTCQICRDSDPPCGKYTLPCSHSFCIDCLTGYLTSKVSDGCVVPKCCYVDEVEASTGEALDKIKICNADIPPPIIDSILEKHDAFLEKYRRFKYIKDNKTARQCPYCAVFNIGKPEATPHMICSNCQRDYCYFHSNAHDFTKYPTCELYEASVAEEQKESVEYLKTNSKQCPGCSLPVMKSGGCNHMKCQCGVAFCWLCGKQVDDSLFPAHFQWWNPSSCSNLQLDDAIEPTVARRCCARVLGVLQLIILGPITLASTLASSLLCFSCIYMKLKNDPSVTLLCGRNTMFSNCMSSWGMIWMFLLIILPLAISLGSIAVSIIVSVMIICYPCYAIVRLASREYPWPDSVTRTTGRIYRRLGRCCGRWGCTAEGWCRCCSCLSSSRQATYAAPSEGESERDSTDFDAAAHAEGERLSREISEFRLVLQELEEGLAAEKARLSAAAAAAGGAGANAGSGGGGCVSDDCITAAATNRDGESSIRSAFISERENSTVAVESGTGSPTKGWLNLNRLDPEEESTNILERV